MADTTTGSKTSTKTDEKSSRKKLWRPTGRIAAATLVVLARTATLIAVIVFAYLLAFFAAVRMVPMIMSFVATGTGVTSEAGFVAMVSLWLMPSVFLIGLVFVGVLALARLVWRMRRKALTRVEDWALGREAEGAKDQATPSLGKARRKKSAR